MQKEMCYLQALFVMFNNTLEGNYEKENDQFRFDWLLVIWNDRV